MTIDNHKILIENVKNENMLVRRLKELKFYKMIGLTKLSEIELLNTLKKHRHQKVSKAFYLVIIFNNSTTSTAYLFFRLLHHFILLTLDLNPLMNLQFLLDLTEISNILLVLINIL